MTSTQYNAIIELDEPPPTPRRAEALLDVLGDYHASISRSDRGRTQVTITLPAETLRQAVTTALSLTAQAGGAPARTIEVMPTDDFDARLGLAPVPDLVSVAEAAEILGLTRQAVQHRLDTGSLPGRRVGKAWVIQRAALAPAPL